MQQTPTLTLGMPVYNAEALVAEALECLLAQTFRDFEIHVSDNASTDRTREIVEAYAARDSRIRLQVNETNIGATRNFDKVATDIRSPYFKWTAHDDRYEPTYLERCIAALEKDPGAVLAHADSIFIDEDGRPFIEGCNPGEWIERKSHALYRADPIDLGEAAHPLARFHHVLFGSLWGTHMFGVIRTSALYRTHFLQNVPSSDRPFLAELALLGRFKGVREPLFLKRFHSRMTLALDAATIKTYVSGADDDYSQRQRQLSVYLATPKDKPIGWLTRNACRGLVIAYSLGVVSRRFRGIEHPAVRPAHPSPAAHQNEATPSAH
ncbi:MAG: glycosyltransferase family 2 protein [Hyphomicrobiaceae bacterium]